MEEIKCKYRSDYCGDEYCDNKQNTDIRSHGSLSQKHQLHKRCLSEFCPLLKIMRVKDDKI